MMELKVINKDEDLKVMSKLANKIWHEHFPGIISNAQIDYMIDKFLSFDVLKQQLKENYHYEGIYLKQDLIGFMVYKDEPNKVFLSKLYVEKQYRGNGYAKQAFNYLIDYTIKQGKNDIWLTCNKTNTSSLDVYKHMGFKIFKEAVNDIGHNFVMDDYYLNYKIR